MDSVHNSKERTYRWGRIKGCGWGPGVGVRVRVRVGPKETAMEGKNLTQMFIKCSAVIKTP